MIRSVESRCNLVSVFSRLLSARQAGLDTGSLPHQWKQFISLLHVFGSALLYVLTSQFSVAELVRRLDHFPSDLLGADFNKRNELSNWIAHAKSGPSRHWLKQDVAQLWLPAMHWESRTRYCCTTSLWEKGAYFLPSVVTKVQSELIYPTVHRISSVSSFPASYFPTPTSTFTSSQLSALRGGYPVEVAGTSELSLMQRTKRPRDRLSSVYRGPRISREDLQLNDSDDLGQPGLSWRRQLR